MTVRSSMRMNLGASWVAHAVTLLAGFLLMPYLLHTLGDRQYGTWIFISSVTSYTALMYLGFGQAIQKFVASHHVRQEWDKLNQTVNVTLAVYAVMGAVALSGAAVACWFAPCFHDWDGTSLLEIRLVILILGLNVACGLVGSVFGGVLLGIQRFDLERGIATGADVLRVGLTLLLLRYEWGLVILAGIFLAVTLAQNLAFAVLAFRHVKTLSIRLRHVKLAVFRECFGFSLFALIGNVAWQFINATDTIVIGLVLGAKSIVPYYIAQRLCQFMQRPMEQIGEVCMPKAGELHGAANAAGLRALAARGMQIAFVLAAGLFIGTAFFGDALILTWMGPGYAESHTLLLVLLSAQLIALPLGVLRSILFGSGQAKGPALMLLAEAVANVVLSLILIRPLGLMGVALGTAISIVAVEMGVLLPYACQRLQFRPMLMARRVVGPLILPLLALVAYCLWTETQFDVSRGWEKLIAVAVGGGAVLGATWGIYLLLQRIWDFFEPEDSKALGKT